MNTVTVILFVLGLPGAILTFVAIYYHFCKEDDSKAKRILIIGQTLALPFVTSKLINEQNFVHVSMFTTIFIVIIWFSTDFAKE